MLKPDLLAYWPREEDVAACVKTDAEASDKAVLLAVHQPMRFHRRVIGGDIASVEPCSEHELLRAFLSSTLSDGRVIIPIVGSSGTGKSHVIRWLDAQIRREAGSERRVIIRIPKGMSLRGVLSLLLEKRKGPAYDKFRQELLGAQEALDPEEAAGLLCEMLAHALTEKGAEAHAALLRAPTDKSAQERDAFCRPDMLPGLLRNNVLRAHFVRSRDGRAGVVRRLVEQLTEDRDASEDDDRKHSFEPDDLLFDSSIDREALGRSEARAVSQLEREDRREVAARILNEVLDNAKQRLLRLDPTVSELFDLVRQELLKEDCELVLLVEDFAVLSGIQKQLLQVIIKEAFRDGRQVLCTMRTALAYTTGYMSTATVLTRANWEYVIPDEPGPEEEILQRIESLVGAYLNAARCGQDVLKEAHANTSSGSEQRGSWIPAFSTKPEAEARSVLEAFGVSSGGYELFPFNRGAIRELSREGCLQSGRLIYNPRFVIQNVINKVLNHRLLFERDDFPSAQFSLHGRPLPARVAEEVRRRVPPTGFERYLSLLAYWGGFPGTTAEAAQLERQVYIAFALQPIAFGVEVPPPVKPPGTSTQPPPIGPEPKPRTHDPDPTELRWESTLEGWRAGATLSQTDANQLRKWIAEGLKGYVDWDWSLHRPRRDSGLDSWFNWVYLPHAAGSGGRGPEDSMAVACTEAELLDKLKSARIQSELMAVVRFHSVQRSSWDYEDAEEDLPNYTCLCERLSNQAREFVLRRYFRADWNPIPALVDGLLIGARALGVESAGKDRDYPALIQSMFAAVGEQAPGTSPDLAVQDATKWLSFADTLRRCRRSGEKENRGQLSWQGHLLALIGARQGQADTVHAIDASRLRQAIDETIKTWEFNEPLPTPTGVLEFPEIRATYADLKKLSSAVGKAQERLSHWRTKTLEWLGPAFDKDAFVREAKETMENARAAGLLPGVNTTRVLQLLEEFRGAKVRMALDDAEKAAGGAPRGTVITILGRGYEPVLRVTEELQLKLDEALGVVQAELASDALKYGIDPLSEAVALLSAELQELDKQFKRAEQS